MNTRNLIAAAVLAVAAASAAPAIALAAPAVQVPVVPVPGPVASQQIPRLPIQLPTPQVPHVNVPLATGGLQPWDCTADERYIPTHWENNGAGAPVLVPGNCYWNSATHGPLIGTPRP